MERTIRKLGQSDFKRRIKRVNRGFHARGGARFNADRLNERPFKWTLLGFGWFYAVSAISLRKEEIQASLAAGTLPPHLHDKIMMGLAVLLSLSLVFLGLHVLRFILRGRMRRNSGGLIFGAMAAVALSVTPPSVFSAGYGLLDNNTKYLVASTRSNLKQIDWSEVVMVSSLGK